MMWSPLTCLLILLLNISPNSATGRGLKFSVLLPEAKHNVTHMSLEQVLPVVDIAIDTVTARGLLHGYHVSIVANDSMCDYAIAPVIAVLLMQEIDLMLGPYCSFCVAAVARYNRLSRYRRPILTAGGVASPLRDKKEYFNLVRVGPNYDGVEKMLLLLFEGYGWKPRDVQTVLFIELPDDMPQEQRTRDEIGVSQSRILSLGFERYFVQRKYIVRRLQYERDNSQFKNEIFRVMRDEVRRKMADRKMSL